uniref:Integral membrane protein 2 n=1 Tax=Latimeria chalumnae TaxID=7897 RepID=H3AMD7_LATCH
AELLTSKDPEVVTSRVHENSTGRCLLTLLGLAFILTGLLVGGACIYKYFIPKRTTLHGEMRYYDFGGSRNSIEDVQTMEPYYLPIEEEADIRETDNVVIIDIPVPHFYQSDPAAIVHDFERKLTAYHDLQLGNCYVIPLNTSVVLPPRSLMDLFIKLATDAYLPQTYLVHENLVVTEEINDVSELGFYIYQLCAGKDTYRLQRRDEIIGLQKRSAENCFYITHFENTYVVQTKICKA